MIGAHSWSQNRFSLSFLLEAPYISLVFPCTYYNIYIQSYNIIQLLYLDDISSSAHVLEISIVQKLKCGA